MSRLEPALSFVDDCISQHADLVYLDLGGTVVELISYEGGAVDPAPQTEHLGYRMMALEVDDMEKMADYLRIKGVDIVWGASSTWRALPRLREQIGVSSRVG